MSASVSPARLPCAAARTWSALPASYSRLNPFFWPSGFIIRAPLSANALVEDHPLTAKVEPASNDHQFVIGCAVNQAVCLIDSPRPIAGQLTPQRFQFADADERTRPSLDTRLAEVGRGYAYVPKRVAEFPPERLKKAVKR